MLGYCALCYKMITDKCTLTYQRDSTNATTQCEYCSCLSKKEMSKRNVNVV